MANKKQIFQRSGVREITRDRRGVQASDSLVSALINLNPEIQYLEITRDLIPERFFHERKDMKDDPLTRTQASRKFMKHGDEIYFPSFKSIDEAVSALKDKRNFPVGLRKERFDNARRGAYCSYSFTPIIGNDKRKRKVPLNEVLEGAKLFAYASHRSPIRVKPYDGAQRVETDGASIDVEAPSRTPKKSRYSFKVTGIPVVDNDKKYVIANMIISTHQCGDTQHRTRYNYKTEKENSEVFNWDAHDIAAMYSIIEHFWNEGKNAVPLSMMQIPIPSQKMAELYEKLLYDTVVLTKENPLQEEREQYPLNNAEMEIMLHGIVQILGHDETLFSKTNRDGNLRDYRWRGLVSRDS